MDIKTKELQNQPIRKIEDIIDIQKANGNINVRQVAFTFPSETDSSLCTNLTRSLETGLSNSKLAHKKQTKNTRSKQRKGSLPDVISWPSDSDITVLRMKMYSSTRDKNVGSIILGDGLHQAHSSSMVNLATLILKPQRPSRQTLVEEYLLPLTSWGRAMDADTKQSSLEDQLTETSEVTSKEKSYQTRSKHRDDPSLKDSDVCVLNTKSKVARFLRLYFCPCCTCLYRLEKIQEEPSACFTKH